MQNQSENHSLPSSAAEVTTMLGSTVIRVDHLDAESKPVKSAPFFAAAGVLLAICLVSFLSAVSLAKQNDADHKAWVESGAAVHEFRPKNRIGLGYDFLAIGGFASGLFALGVGIARFRQSRLQSSFRVGDSEDADLQSTGIAPQELVRCDMHGPTVAVGVGAVEVVYRGTILDPAAASEAGLVQVSHAGYRPVGDAAIRVGVGKAHILVKNAQAPRRGGLAGGFAFDSRSSLILAGSLVAHAALLALLWNIPRDAESLFAENIGSDTLSNVRNSALDDPPPEPKPEESGGENAGEAGSMSSPPKGTHGDPKETATSGRFEIKKRADKPRMSRAQAVALAREAGVLGHFNSGDLFADSMSDFSSSSMWGEKDIMGGFDGEPGAVFGEMSSQFGSDAGHGHNLGYELIGNGPLSKIGMCDPTKTKCKTGYGVSELGGPNAPKRTSKVPKPTVSIPRVGGGPDKDTIRRYIKRKRDRIAHCYERELLASPNLKGTVNVTFVISASGAVVGATGTGLSHGNLRSCVVGTIKSIKFPRMSTGSSISVKYPFHFHVTQ